MAPNHAPQKTRREKERDRLLALIAKRPTNDQEFKFSGVLLNDAIEQCVTKFDLITPFDRQNLKPANYKLRIGDEFAIAGQIHSLSDKTGENQITIEPFDVAVIKTLETINMPRFLIGRWNIRVQLAYEGLLWVGGPQVDAGYVGYLFCPIYNLSDKPVTLHYGDPIAVIDFIKTSDFNQGSSQEYPGRLPERLLFEDYNPQKLRSALSTRVVSQLRDFENRINNLTNSVEDRIRAAQGRIDTFISIVFAVVGLLLAAVTLFFGKPSEPNWWDPSVFWVCALAIIISMFAWTNSRTTLPWFRRTWQRTLFEITLFLLVTVSIFASAVRTQSQVEDLSNAVHGLQTEVQRLRSAQAPASSSNPNLNGRTAIPGTSKQ